MRWARTFLEIVMAHQIETFGFCPGDGFPACQIRVVTDSHGVPALVAKDVAEALGYSWNGSARIEHVPAEWRGVTSVVTPSGIQDMSVLYEQGLYFFLSRSDKPAALPMQKWIAGEVIPSIRKTGSYSLNKPEEMSRLQILEMAIESEKARLVLEGKVLADAPKVEFAMAVRNTDDTITVAKFAKLLGQGEIKFFRWLREEKILYLDGRANVPYQRYIDVGYFKVVENEIKFGQMLPQSLITGRGQVWLEKRWRITHTAMAVKP